MDREVWALASHRDGSAVVLPGTHGVIRYGQPVVGQGVVFVEWDFVLINSTIQGPYGAALPFEKVSAR